MGDGQLIERARDREEYGCIVSSENADGKTLVIHRVGASRVALKAACEIAGELDETFRIVSYSTPNTIYADLRGRKIQEGFTTPMSVECTVATGAGLRRMLHPRLLGNSDGKRPERVLRFDNAKRAARERGA
jgi:hypothetical protein